MNRQRGKSRLPALLAPPHSTGAEVSAVWVDEANGVTYEFLPSAPGDDLRMSTYYETLNRQIAEAFALPPGLRVPPRRFEATAGAIEAYVQRTLEHFVKELLDREPLTPGQARK